MSSSRTRRLRHSEARPRTTSDGSLLTRLATARHSKDVDVFFNATNADVGDAVDALRAALRINLGDHFGFDVTRVALLQEEAKGARVHVNARLGPTSSAAGVSSVPTVDRRLA